MIEAPSPHDTVSVVISGNDSLTARDGWMVYGSLVVLTIIIAGAWTALGFWVVLPFAGLELGMLALAVTMVRRRAGYHELLVIGRDEVTLERGRSEAKREVLHWPLAWTRIELIEARARPPRSQLMVCVSGKRTEIAHMLAEAERRTLYRRLCELLADARGGGQA